MFNRRPLPVATHDSVFLERYPRLLSEALHLSERDRGQAEDLVHDAFVQFTLRQPPLDTITNLDGYLYGMLRHLRISQVRRSARYRPLPSIVDYDSAEIGLRTVDARDRLHAWVELDAICRFACDRKESSKTGSVLILRFFLGYYPREIAQVMQAQPSAVAQWLQLARMETRRALEAPAGRPAAARGVFADAAAERHADHPVSDSLVALRGVIGESRLGICVSRRSLSELYEHGAAAVDTPVLAHIVSCSRCLDQVNRQLGLPLLQERYPLDTLGPDRPSGPGPSSGPTPGGLPGAPRKGLMRRARDIFEHKPRELQVAVNGFPVAAQPIVAGRGELELTLNGVERIGFVEIFSEQGLRLLLCEVDPPPEGDVHHAAAIDLSDDRSLDIDLQFAGAWPTLRVRYHDPAPIDAVSAAPLPARESQDAAEIPADVAPDPPGTWWQLNGWSLRPVWLVGVLLVLVVGWPALTSAAQRIGETFKTWLQRPVEQAAPVARPSPGPAPFVPPVPPAASDASASIEKKPETKAVTVAMLIDLEVRVLAALQRAGAFMGEQVTVERSPQRVTVRALVESADRKAQMIAAVRPAGDRSMLDLRIETVAEASARAPARPSALIFRDVEVPRDRSLAADRLHQYFADKGAAAPGQGEAMSSVDDQVRSFADRVVTRSREARYHALALDGLVRRFEPAALQREAPDAFATWKSLLRQEAGAFLAGIELLRVDLTPIFAPDAANAVPRQPATPKDEDLAGGSARIRSLAERQHAAVRRAFVVSTDTQGGSDVLTATFWHDLEEVERLTRTVLRFGDGR